jgi:hypothetical protein
MLGVEDPGRGETLADVADAAPEEAVQAMDAAVAAQADWAATAPRKRSEILTEAYLSSARSRVRAPRRDGDAAGQWFLVNGWMTSPVTALRGVEGGYAVARPARNGLMSVSDRYGRILAEGTSGSQIATLMTRLPAAGRREPTIFVAFNWAFSWLGVLGAAAVVWSLRWRRSFELPLS